MLQIISTVIFYLWMFATLVFVWRIWRNSVTTLNAWQTLMDVIIKTSNAAHEAAKAAATLAQAQEKL